MPPSMRAQTLTHKKRTGKRQEEAARRAKLLSLIQRGESARKASRETGVSRTTATRIKRAYESSEKVALKKLLDPEGNHAGRKTVLSADEEHLVVQRTIHAAQRGFAVDNTVMSTVHAKIAADRCAKYANVLPSPDAIRSFRARNRSLAYRVAENVTTARLAAENLPHISSLKRALQQVEHDYPGIFSEPSRIWNWDETAVLGEYGKKVRCYASATTHSGGARRSIRDSGKHVTAGIAVAACGSIAPLFLIASGKRVVTAWKKPLRREDYTDSQGVPHWLCGRAGFRQKQLSTSESAVPLIGKLS